MKVLLKCGHVANAVDEAENPVCAICFGICEGSTTIDENPPSLKNRKARCAYCDLEKESSLTLPFFEYRGPGSKYETQCKNCGFFANIHPSQGGTGCYLNSSKKIETLCENNGKVFNPRIGGYEHDSFYCGCRGWD